MELYVSFFFFFSFYIRMRTLVSFLFCFWFFIFLYFLFKFRFLSCSLQQAITALKKGAQLLKYGRRGKPKFCPFRVANVRHKMCLNVHMLYINC